jgi:hypothetical protein
VCQKEAAERRRSDAAQSADAEPPTDAGCDPNGNPIGIGVISVRRSSGEIAPAQAPAG